MFLTECGGEQSMEITTLRGLNFADHSIRKILTLSRGFNFADGPFQNILRISSIGLDKNFSQISRIDKAVLETRG